ncbi:hypothetical protein FVE85_7539 [Porphyridium purpureum]|uniref:N-acetyltransferase domain-containing protein n=1 Tax=Porphyridium purpureum TaxID=35688 RepID=A0A5J4ZAH4_PORPP|nr:hypothetical protein FVE85_7539 [Porphyridium purpureum]|eukprot:POR1784..scf295_1
MEVWSASPLGEDVVDDAADLVADAFLESPAYKYILHGVAGHARAPPARARRERDRVVLRMLFRANLRVHAGDRIFSGAFAPHEHARRLVCFFMLRPSSVAPPKIWRELWLALQIVWYGGVGTLWRLIRVKNWFESTQKQVVRGYPGASRGGPYLTLERMVVRPELQGQGVGSRCLAAALQEADALQLPVFLATQEERNVEFYSRLGFRVALAEPVPLDIGGYPNFFMVRDHSQDR